jgi:Histidine kinase-, DNA gyrase B-, and HSP90-like ATPase
MSSKVLNATPEKRVFLSIIPEYDLKRSVCELIDNAIDLWAKSKRADLEVKIVSDERQQTISIQDNAGGIEESKLDHVVSPGKTTNDIHDEAIGYFGVGSKRAVIALSQDIAIHSRFEHEKPYVVKLDEHWITEDPSWLLPYYESTKQLDPYTTLVELNGLRIQITSTEINELKKHLREVYAKFIDRGAVIKVNAEKLDAINFDDQWSYPPNLFPSRFSATIPIEDRKVDVEIVSGLIDHPGEPDNSYGVFVYCNNRLIARSLTDFSVGFSTGMIGNPHYNISLVRTIVRLKGQSADMPWNSSKSGIDTKHPVFQAIRNGVVDATKRYAQISRSLQGKWDSDVFPYKTGRVLEERLENISSIPKTYLPTPPVSKPRWRQKVTEANKLVVDKKPWSVGLLESMIAADAISKMPLSQKNRIGLVILDSTVEIAYKEYLVNEKKIGMTRFNAIARNRADVQKEVAKHLRLGGATLKKIDYYYKLRCNLIHQQATPAIDDSEIAAYRRIVEALLKRMFGLKFA